jgi:hypothetical protein
MAEMSPLRRRMIEDMTVRNLSPTTQRSYIHAVSKISRHFGRSPDRLGLEEVRAFQVHLVSMRISWGALNQTVCALRFFYGVTLGKDEIPERIPYARKPKKLPVILSAEEVVRFLQATTISAPSSHPHIADRRNCRKAVERICARGRVGRILQATCPCSVRRRRSAQMTNSGYCSDESCQGEACAHPPARKRSKISFDLAASEALAKVRALARQQAAAAAMSSG